MHSTEVIPEASEDPLPSPSSFIFRRLGAAAVDASIVGVVSSFLFLFAIPRLQNTINQLPFHEPWMLMIAVFGVAFVSSFFWLDWFFLLAPPFLVIVGFPEWIAFFLVAAGISGFNLLYHCVFESSKQMGTPGKTLMGLRVSDIKFQRLSFFRAGLRHFSKSLTLIACLFPLAILTLCNRFQLIHDRVVRTYVSSGDKALQVWKSAKEPQSMLVLQANGNMLPTSHKIEYASVPARIGSSVLDAVFYYSLVSPISIFISAQILEHSDFLSPFKGTEHVIWLGTLAGCAYVATSIAVTIILAVCEASRFQTTPGKMVCGLQVISGTKERIGFWQALRKHYIQVMVWSSLVPLIFLPMTISYFWFDKFALGAMGLLGNLLFYAAYGLLMCVTLVKGNQTFVDKLSNRYVIVESSRNKVIE